MSAYPSPRETGGRLIRTVVRAMREARIELPVREKLAVAVSGGADSVALAHLVARYGRRVAPKKCLEIVHVNHRWRGVDSDRDADFVADLARKLGLPFRLHLARAPGGLETRGLSWEADAREQRKRFFRGYDLVLTAHQRDDLVETILWRILSGAPRPLHGGIRLRHGNEIRPFLGVSRKEIVAYLNEEGIEYREDATNRNPRFLRARIRHEILPAIYRSFPGAGVALSRYAAQLNELAK